MKALNSAPLVIKLVGFILILSSLVDYVALLIPFRYQDNNWLATTLTQLVDRGIIPMVGLAFLFLGYFLENGTFATDRGNSFLSARFWTLILSSLLGLVFLVVVPPLHLNNTRILSDRAIQQVNQDATKAESDLNTQVQQRQEQITTALKDENQRKQLDAQLQQIDNAIKSGQVKGDDLTKLQQAQKELEQLKSDPSSVEARAKDFRNQGLIQIRDRKQQLEQQARTESWKTGLRVGISSLLLGLGYSLIGWTGLREMRVFGGSRPKAPRV
jgi:membrane-associated HD superfamily phosphohydrolase